MFGMQNEKDVTCKGSVGLSAPFLVSSLFLCFFFFLPQLLNHAEIKNTRRAGWGEEVISLGCAKYEEPL